jgi:acyl dehydratase
LPRSVKLAFNGADASRCVDMTSLETRVSTQDSELTSWVGRSETVHADGVPPPPQQAEQGAPWQRSIVPEDVLLFRYSALTFNGHRIHYDRKYVTEVEGYPGLIVHGPLIATLLMDLLRRQMPQAGVAAFRFKAVRPAALSG